MARSGVQRVHGWLVEDSGLYSNVLDAAGEYDAKVDSTANSSLAAHILNAVAVGVNTFVYTAVGDDESVDDYEEDIRVLAAALALHDTNKYIREAYGVDTDGNTHEAFEYYFEPNLDDESGDDFGIEEFLGEGYREDLLYLVQNTEISEDSTETRGTSSEFRGLERYTRIGDQAASIALRDGVHGVYDQLKRKLDADDVHLVEFTAVEQPVLNDLLLGTTKAAIAGERGMEHPGLVIGSDQESIVYLGDSIDREQLEGAVADTLPKQISNSFDFSCKLNWNSFDYDILAEIELPFEEKEDTIAKAFEKLLSRGSAGVEAFEHIPDSFHEYFPVLAKAVYVDGRSEFDDDAVQEEYDRIRDEQGPQKVKLHFIAYLVNNAESHHEFLEDLREKTRPELEADLTPESDAISAVVDRFFGSHTVEDLPGKDEMCFLCGAPTETKYQKGLSAVYRTQEYSRRVPPHAKYKSICEVCNLEYALFADICDQSDVSTNNNVEVAYFYFDEFLGDIRLRRRRTGNIVQGNSDELDDRDVQVSLIKPQYYLQPVYVMDENHRMQVVRQVMAAARESGMKVVIGRPFTRFDGADAVFADEEATRPQELLGLDVAERFGPKPSFVDGEDSQSHLRRALQLFKIMSMVGAEAKMTNPYLQLDQDTFHSIANFAVVNHDYATQLDVVQSYFETYHQEALMEMRTVAERGVDLFGKQFDSKYKKTKIFREALDAFLSGMNQQMEDEQLVDYVESQVYATAQREDYAGRVTPEQAQAFVEATRTYLIENDLYNLKKLSDWEDALVNSYYYAFDQTLTDS
ncbi:hypothetical protein [Haloarchaeobius amylolyticus]|uniref:hypothetical protein n=1 Tax=Haloarchaeobius amylolyticus TaxID=1198296 RepID=UPI0022712D7A|nr:hypothetical protein [Haloarchaeobius amylolyticus]